MYPMTPATAARSPPFNVASLAWPPGRTSRSKRSTGEQQRQHGSGRCAAGTIHSGRTLSTSNLTSVRLAGKAAQSGYGVPAPVIRRQRRLGCRAAAASSSRRTGALVRGARHELRAEALALAAMAMRASANASKRRNPLGLGRLDQHPFLDDQREIDRRRVVAVVDQPLGDVEGPDPGPVLDRGGGGDEFVLAITLVAGCRRVPAEARLQVVRGEDGVIADLAQARSRRGPGCTRTRGRGRRCCRRSVRNRPIEVGRSPAARGGTRRRPRAGPGRRAGTG